MNPTPACTLTPPYLIRQYSGIFALVTSCKMVGGKGEVIIFQHGTPETDFWAVAVKKLIQFHGNLSVLKFI